MLNLKKHFILFLLFSLNITLFAMEEPESDNQETNESSSAFDKELYDEALYNHLLNKLMNFIDNDDFENVQALIYSFQKERGHGAVKVFMRTYHREFRTTPLRLATSKTDQKIKNFLTEIFAGNKQNRSKEKEVENDKKSFLKSKDLKPLMVCIERSDLEQLTIIIKGLYGDNAIDEIINRIDTETGLTPLTLAVALGSENLTNLWVIFLLLLNGADIQLKNGNQQDAFDIASKPNRYGRPDTAMQVFLESNLISKDYQKFSNDALVINAALTNVLKLRLYDIAIGILNGCEYKFKNHMSEILNILHPSMNHLPLTIAVKKQNYILVHELITKGADFLRRNQKGKSAFEIANQKNSKLNDETSNNILGLIPLILITRNYEDNIIDSVILNRADKYEKS